MKEILLLLCNVGATLNNLALLLHVIPYARIFTILITKYERNRTSSSNFHHGDASKFLNISIIKKTLNEAEKDAWF